MTIRTLTKKLSSKASASTAQPPVPITLSRGVIDTVGAGGTVHLFLDGSTVSVAAKTTVPVSPGDVVEVANASPRLLVLGVLAPPTWTAATMQNAWTADSGHAPGYVLIGEVVYLHGSCSSGALGTVAFTLPAGLRPTVGVWASCTDGLGGSAACLIGTDGTVEPTNGGTTNFRFDGITFLTL